MNKGTWEFVGYIALAGVLVGYYGFREPFMEWFWWYGLPIAGLLGAPIVLGAIFYFVVVFLLVRLVIGFFHRFFGT